jgi:ferric iron reductase protein FhuF
MVSMHANGRQSVIGKHQGASYDAPEPVEFSALLVAATGDRYAYCKDSLVLRPKAGTRVVACRDLADAATFAGLIDRFSHRFAGADRRAIVSMWTLYYFSTLTIAVAVAGLELKRKLPAALDDVSLCVDPDTAAPQAFVLPDFGHEAAIAPIETMLHALLRGHCEPLIEAMVAHSGVGRRLLWNNVAAYLDWIVGEIGRTNTRPDIAGAIAFYQRDAWSDGWKNPLNGLIRQECDENGNACGRRKVCCLRYGLPGVSGCGISCPLPQGRS